jgi:hypothetical protein
VWAVGAVTSPSTRGSGDSGDDDRFARWQDITRRSLDFVNNVLIVLTSGLIAVVLNEAASTTTVASLHRWQLVCAGTAVILLGVSVAAGVFTAANRLQSGRLTARRLRIGMLYRGITSAERDADGEAYRKIAGIFRTAASALGDASRAWDAAGSADRAAQARNDATQAGACVGQTNETAGALLFPVKEQVDRAAERTRIADLARQAAEQARRAALEAAEAAAGAERTAAGAEDEAGETAREAATNADRAAEQGQQIAAEPATDGKSWDERALARLIRSLAGLESLTRPTIKSAAERCLAKDRPGVVRDNGAIEGLKQALREWSDGADNRTWWLVRIQLWSFLLGSAFFAAVPIWILLSAT